MARPASTVALNWVRFFGHLCTFIGFFAEKLASFRNFTTHPLAFNPFAPPREPPHDAPTARNGGGRDGLPLRDIPPRARCLAPLPAATSWLCQRTNYKSAIANRQFRCPAPGWCPDLSAVALAKAEVSTTAELRKPESVLSRPACGTNPPYPTA